MDINPLTHLLNSKETHSNGNARITQATPIDEALKAQKVPSVVYHGSSDHLPENTGGTVTNIYIASTETNEQVSARLSKVVQLLSKDLGNASADLKLSYDSAMAQLPSSLTEKDWGFSVKDNKLTITLGADTLSKQEMHTLHHTMIGAGVEFSANTIAGIVSEALALDRGPAGVSKGIGRYDVSVKNFGDTVDLRTYLQSHEPGGRYGQHRINPSDISGLFFTGGQAMMDQITTKAEEKHTRPADFGRL